MSEKPKLYGVVPLDHPDLVKGVKRAIKNIEGSGDLKTDRIARLTGVPHREVREMERQEAKRK